MAKGETHVTLTYVIYNILYKPNRKKPAIF